jgi:sulfate adenylyltransferase large subunit
MTLVETQRVSLERFSKQAGEKSLLRFSTAGSVDDGKSTLIGRLLHDTGGAFDDQVEAVKKSKINRAGEGRVDFSLFTDGLKAEREQGITIDVAYRYFATPRRKFIVADTPGHEQYTRNMATGASNAEVAIILVDARNGMQPQSRRHATISALLGIRHLVVAINKMDLVDFSPEVFAQIERDFRSLGPLLRGAALQFIPLSALDGDNVITRSARTPWYTGPSLLEFLETIEVDDAPVETAFRFPVQFVNRPHLDFRGFAGQIASGSVAVGDAITVLPSGKTSTVDRIVTFDGDLAEAIAPMSVTLTLADEVDVSRGDTFVLSSQQPPSVGREFAATFVWMSETPLDEQKSYLLRQGPREVTARLRANGVAMELNAVGEVFVETNHPLAFDTYQTNRRTGALVLIDPITNLTLGAGMIERALASEGRRKAEHRFELGPVTPAERRQAHGHRGAVITYGSQFALAQRLERALFEKGGLVLLLDAPVAPLAPIVAAGAVVLVPASDESEFDLAAYRSLTAAMAALEKQGIVAARDEVMEGEGI